MMKEPQYYPADEQVRQQIEKTQDAAWAIKVPVYGAAQGFEGWPSIWELLSLARTANQEWAVDYLKTLTARLLAEGAGQVVDRLPEETKKRFLELVREKF